MRRLILCLSLLLAGPAFAQAGLSIAPVRLQIAPGSASTSFTVVNPSEESRLLQTRLKRWTRVDGEDRYDDDETLIVTPPLFTLAAQGGSQVVRIGFPVAAVAPAVEQAWRAFVEEVPDAAHPPKPGEVRLTLRFGLPLFVPPARPQRALDWRLVREGGRLSLLAVNGGNVHARFDQLALLLPDGQSLAQWPGPIYVFPGETRAFPVDLPKPGHATLRLSAQGGDGLTERALSLPP